MKSAASDRFGSLLTMASQLRGESDEIRVLEMNGRAFEYRSRLQLAIGAFEVSTLVLLAPMPDPQFQELFSSARRSRDVLSMRRTDGGERVAIWS